MDWWELGDTGDPVANRIIDEHTKLMMQAGMPNFGLIWRARRYTEMIIFEAIKHFIPDHQFVRQMNNRSAKEKPKLDKMILALNDVYPDPLLYKEIRFVQEIGNQATHFQVEFSPADRQWSTIRGPIDSLTRWILNEKVGEGNYHLIEPQTTQETIESVFRKLMSEFPIEDDELVFDGAIIDQQFPGLQSLLGSLAPNMSERCQELIDLALNDEHMTLATKRKVIMYANSIAFYTPAVSFLKIIGESQPQEEE